MSFSVLLSVYKDESPSYLKQALLSIWDDQLLKPSQIVIVRDGPLTSDLNSVLVDFKAVLGGVLTEVSIDKNVGLGAALNEGLKHCQYELVARMDTDDVALPNRFARQAEFMLENPDVSVCSTWVQEFDQNLKNSQGLRKVPVSHEEIVNFGKRRNPLSHPAVIFRKSAVLGVGGYPPFRKSQDYALWSLLLSRGYKMANIPEVLLHMRTGDGLMARRGLSYLMHEYRILRFQKDIGFIGWKDYLVNLAIRTTVRLPPAPIKRMLYKLAR
ncbi:glycosyltransferase [Halomonas rhizosphaerae]|uniref:Glycosyltransferase n=1 Tax=Halomonas rhizosphaerae TaxID=3043296 RepID=A0ABT6UWD5_9GAMM|nr:glycosyltransferase [Halomonas rhizosphaerae]MDI5890277.1 glycosyltransferase [Halomonas rhizosphaerae]